MVRAAESQTSRAVLMIRPAHFGSNPETAASNVFQQRGALPQAQELALREFDLMVTALRRAGVSVELFADTPSPVRPDAVFPNNWVSFHTDGTVVLYPMQAQNRRWERRSDLLEALCRERGYRITRVEDLSAAELDGRFLEGTGSLVLDRVHRIAYACLSARTDEKLLRVWGQRLGYEVFPFHAVDTGGRPVYHTNIMLCIGRRFAVLCAEAVPENGERQRLLQSLESNGREVIVIDRAQMSRFAGNLLELATADGGALIVLSARALRALTPAQRAALESHGHLLACPVNTIETCSGGSVRCMLAEIFLPREDQRPSS